MSNLSTAVMSRVVSKSTGTGGPSLPLSMVRAGDKVKVRSISGPEATRRFLSNLGFVEAAEVSIVSEFNGNVIVSVKGSRVAISKAMASRVMTM